MVRTAEVAGICVAGGGAQEMCGKRPLAHVQEEARKPEREQQLEGCELSADSRDLLLLRDPGVSMSQSAETSLNSLGLQLRPQKD